MCHLFWNTWSQISGHLHGYGAFLSIAPLGFLVFPLHPTFSEFIFYTSEVTILHLLTFLIDPTCSAIRSDSKDWRADMFSAHRGPQLDLRPVGSFARPPPALYVSREATSRVTLQRYTPFYSDHDALCLTVADGVEEPGLVKQWVAAGGGYQMWMGRKKWLRWWRMPRKTLLVKGH